MKFIITALTLILIIACNENSENNGEGNLETWQIDNSTAEKMIDAASECNDSSGKECEITGSSDTKNVQDFIDSLYPETGFNNTYVKARYSTDADVERYRKLHDLKPDDSAGNIKGLLTYLYKVTALHPADNKNAVKYFEFVSICRSGNCSDNANWEKNTVGGRAINPDDWKIDTNIAKAMIAHWPNRAEPMVTFDTNSPVYLAIRAQYDDKKDSFQWVPATYKTFKDQRRYRRLRNFDPTDRKGWARNAETRILKIFSKQQQVRPAVVDTSYYDLGYSCPPPFPADCGGMHGNGPKKN
jgi:hypothetical protein